MLKGSTRRRRRKFSYFLLNNAFITEDGYLILTEDGQVILKES